MTTTDRLRAAVEPDALKQTRKSIPDLLGGLCVHGYIDYYDRGEDRRAASDCDECIQIVMDELTARDAEIARLRAVLEWAAELIDTPNGCMAPRLRVTPGVVDAAIVNALRGEWAAVRAAGVALPEEK